MKSVHFIFRLDNFPAYENNQHLQEDPHGPLDLF